MSFGKNIKDSMKKSDFGQPVFLGITAQVIFEFIGITIIITAISFIAYCQVSTMFNNALEESVARNTKTIAYELNKQFKLEISGLVNLAKIVEENKLSSTDLVVALEDSAGKHAGIISERGNLIAGGLPPDEIIQAVYDAYGGENVIRYVRNVGLVFAVPMNLDGQRCILFDYYNDEAVRDKFKTISYNGDGTVILLNSRKDWTVIADGTALINTHKDMDKGWDELGKKVGYDPKSDTITEESGAIFYEFQDNSYFLYIATVSNEYHFGISGYVPWHSVAVGFESIYTVMLIVFGLIALVLIMVARTIYKNRENKQLRQEKLLALKASQTKSDFLSNMSHEIRTPINAILGMDEMILRESKDKNILEYAENLRHAGNSLLGIVNDILDFSKIEAGKMEIINVEYSLSSLLNDLVNMIQKRAEKKNLKLIVNADKNLPSVLYGDEIRIKQIVTNILTNAVKYTEEGSVTLNVNFEPRDENSIWLKVSVVDTGIGIKQEDIEKLFTAFERIEEERNRTIEGTGLGMNITQQLLFMMESHLEVSSVYGEGSTFSFKLAQKIVNSEPLGNFSDAFKSSLTQHKEYHEKFTAPNAKILVVDDTVMNLTVVKGLLKQTKIKIDTAESGYDCLDLVKKNHYDIIFLDHRMPGLDGIETLQKMKTLDENKNSDTPVISLTANAISGAREQYIAAGFKDYLTKPINSSALENLIIKYLPADLVNISEENSEEEVTDSINLPEWLKEVKGLDIESGIAHCGGIEPYLDALTVFADAVNSGAKEIQNYFDKADWKNYTTKVHALKSTAKVIGASELSDRAKRLEDAGNSGYIEEIFEGTPELLNLYKSYEEKLSPLLENESDNADKPLISDDELAEAYETLKEISASFDFDSLEFVIKSLEAYKIPESEREKFKNLKTAANNLDWDEIKKLVD